nr:hypothetical protein CFP56_52768 [Quercus suber]
MDDDYSMVFDGHASQAVHLVSRESHRSSPLTTRLQMIGAQTWYAPQSLRRCFCAERMLAHHKPMHPGTSLVLMGSEHDHGGDIRPPLAREYIIVNKAMAVMIPRRAQRQCLRHLEG